MILSTKYGQINALPHYSGLPLIGHAINALRDPLGFLQKLSVNYGEAVKINIAGKLYYVIQSPTAFKHILKENAKNYIKPGTAKELKKVLGEGLATSNGPVWMRQRKLMQPAFHRTKIESMVSIIEEDTDLLVHKWKSISTPHTENITTHFLNLTLGNITKAMFGTDLHDRLDDISYIIGNLLKFGQATSIVNIPLIFPTPTNLKYQYAREKFEEIISHIIAKRSQESTDNIYNQNDLLGMLMSSFDEESKSYMTPGQLRDEITTIFMAGHETTAQTMSWVFYLLASNPQVYEQVRDEADKIGNGNLSLEKLQQLSYTKNVIEETLRQYPPIWIIARKSLAADQVTDTLHIPEGATVLLNVYGVHHRASYWDTPAIFDPMRFHKKDKLPYPPFAYIPFGGGQRGCIGHQFAMMVMQTVVCRLVQQFKFECPQHYQPVIDAGITLRAKGGITLIVKNRKKT